LRKTSQGLRWEHENTAWLGKKRKRLMSVYNTIEKNFTTSSMGNTKIQPGLEKKGERCKHTFGDSKVVAKAPKPVDVL
jgi:hypothetical protein